MSALYRFLFGLPDGVFIALRCRLFGHRWTPCEDECCGRAVEWCYRCLTCRDNRDPGSSSAGRESGSDT